MNIHFQWKYAYIGQNSDEYRHLLFKFLENKTETVFVNYIKNT